MLLRAFLSPRGDGSARRKSLRQKPPRKIVSPDSFKAELVEKGVTLSRQREIARRPGSQSRVSTAAKTCAFLCLPRRARACDRLCARRRAAVGPSRARVRPTLCSCACPSSLPGAHLARIAVGCAMAAGLSIQPAFVALFLVVARRSSLRLISPPTPGGCARCCVCGCAFPARLRPLRYTGGWTLAG